MTLQVGDKAPQFTVVADNNQPVNLADFKGKKVVLYFYPKDNTPGCTKQACGFRDSLADFEQLNTVVLGVSKDSAAKHVKFKQKYGLPFTLLADEAGEVCEVYEVLKDKNLFGHKYRGIERSTFLIDEQGVIQAIWRKVKVGKHVEMVKEALEK